MNFLNQAIARLTWLPRGTACWCVTEVAIPLFFFSPSQPPSLFSSSPPSCHRLGTQWGSWPPAGRAVATPCPWVTGVRVARAAWLGRTMAWQEEVVGTGSGKPSHWCCRNWEEREGPGRKERGERHRGRVAMSTPCKHLLPAWVPCQPFKTTFRPLLLGLTS